MKSVLFLFAVIIGLCQAHTLVTNVTIGGRTTNECLRPASGDSSPVMSSTGDRNGLMSANYTCGFLPRAAGMAKASCSIAAGQSMNVSYYHGANYGTETKEFDNWIASSHRGPFLVYMARWELNNTVPSGLAWFKIFHSGIIANTTTGDFKNIKWASPDTLNANNGAMTFTIPPQLAPGRYLLRTEIIALHDSKERGAQPYVRCIDLTVTGRGTVVPKDLVALPGAIGYNDTGLRFNVYQTRNQVYPIPGPAVYDFTKNPAVPSGNGSITDLSCAGFVKGACPSPSTCDLTTGRCKCPAGTIMSKFACLGAASPSTPSPSKSASTTPTSTSTSVSSASASATRTSSASASRSAPSTSRIASTSGSAAGSISLSESDETDEAVSTGSSITIFVSAVFCAIFLL